MSEEQRYETQRMDQHGIVAGICHEFDLDKEIDQMESGRILAWLEVLSWNSSDKSTFMASIKAYSNQLLEEEQGHQFKNIIWKTLKGAECGNEVKTYE